MGEAFLVAFILKDESDIPYIKDGMKANGREIIVKGKEVFFDNLYFKVTHFRVLDLSTFGMYDISVDEYCKSDLFILGLSNSVRDYYKDSSSKWKKPKILKDISLNINGQHRIVKKNRYSLSSGINGVGFDSKVPFIYDNRAVYGDELVILQFDEWYIKGLKIVINYITGDFGFYICDELLIGKDLVKFDIKYFIDDTRYVKGLSEIKDYRFGVLNLFFVLGFISEDYYIHNNDYAILYDYPKDGVILFSSSIKTILLLRNIGKVAHNCTIVVPPNASIKCLEDRFNLDYEYGIKFVISNKLSYKDLKDLVVNIGACPYNFNRKDIVDIVKKDCGIAIEFY